MAFAVTRSLGAIPGLAAAALTLGLGLSLCLITPGASARAEAAQFRPTPKVINTLSSTYGFVIAQDITLSRIAEEYPASRRMQSLPPPISTMPSRTSPIAWRTTSPL